MIVTTHTMSSEQSLPQAATSGRQAAVGIVLAGLLAAWLVFVFVAFDQEFAAGKGQAPEYFAQLRYMSSSPFSGLLNTAPWLRQSGTASLASWTLTTERWGSLGYIFQLPTVGGLLRAAGHLLAGGGLLLLTLALGLWLARLLRLQLDDPPLILLPLLAGLGYCGVYTVYTLLTLGHLLYPWITYSLTGLLLAGALLTLARERSRVRAWWRTHLPHHHHPRERWQGLDWFLLGVLLVTALLNLATALAPPVLNDALLYHLALPKVYLQHNGFVPVYNTFFILMAEGMEMLYAWPMSLFGAQNISGGITSSLLHFSIGILTTVFSYGVARRFGLSRTAGLIVACCFLVTPLVGREVGTAYVDVGTAYFSVLCLWTLYRYCTASHYSGLAIRWLVAAALFAGMASEVKLFAVTLFPVIAVAVLGKWWTVSRREGIRPARTLRGYLAAGLVAAVVGGLFASHWYIVSWMVLGNPIWPVANLKLGGWFWNEQAEASYQQIVRIFFYSNEGAPFTLGNLARYASWDFSLANTLPIPRGGPLSPRTVPLLTALLPLGTIPLCTWLVGRLRGRKLAAVAAPSYQAPAIAPILWGVAYSVAFLVFWFVVQGQLRYLLFSLPLFGLLAGWNYDWLRRRWPLTALPLNLFLVAAILVTSLANLSFNARAFSSVYGRVDDASYVQDRAAIRWGEQWQTMRYLNRAATPQEAVLFVDLVPLYYLDRDFVISDPGRDNFLAYEQLKTAADFKARLDAGNFRYFNHNREATSLAPLDLGAEWAGRTQYTHLEYVQGSWYTYRKDAEPTAQVDASKIINPSMDGSQGNMCTLGYDGANPLTSLGAWGWVSLDGLDRLSSQRLASCTLLLVNRHSRPLPPLTVQDDDAVQPTDPATLAVALRREGGSRLETADYSVYPVDGRRANVPSKLRQMLGLTQVIDLKPWSVTNGTAAISFEVLTRNPLVPRPLLGASVPLTTSLVPEPFFQPDGISLALTGTLTPTAALKTAAPLKLDMLANGNPILPAISATVQSAATPLDVRAQRAIAFHLRLSLGAQVEVSASVDGQFRILEAAFNGTGDGVDDTLILPIPADAKQIGQLTFRISAPPGGTANLRDFTLHYGGGQPAANFALLGLDLLAK